MTKSIRMMEQNIKLVDAVIYVLDARAVSSSINPYFEDIIKDKKRLYVINKSDLADAAVNTLWLKYFTRKGDAAVLCDGRNIKGAKEIITKLNMLLSDKKQAYLQKGVNLPLRAMVIGIPNSGKSTIINTLGREKKAQTGNIAGVTRGKQWIKLSSGIELLDTPGTLWNAFEKEQTGFNLAFVGSIKEEVTDTEEVAVNLLKQLSILYPKLLKQKYGIKTDDCADNMLNEICIKKGCMIKGEADKLRAAKAVLDDFKKGRIGKISLESPENA